jgi:ABC-type bacteriocin/lantibiotic exporter with double-glycine peptidase domain
MNDKAVIEVRNLNISFTGNPPLFSGFSFSAAAGEKIALTGPSGCGKTTLLHCLIGLVEPNAGDILINGEPLNRQTVWHLRGEIGFVPQEPDLGQGSVREFIERPFSYRINASRRENLSKAPQLLEKLGLKTELLNARTEALSGGEKQRIALTSALLLERPVLLLDEITSALDDKNAGRVFELLKELPDITVIGVVHNRVRMPFATREITLGGGT